jgi:hypothetical protein
MIKAQCIFEISETAYGVTEHRGGEEMISQLLFSLVSEPQGEY